MNRSRFTRIVKSGFKVAMTHKLRASFMMLSVMIGIIALTIIISIGSGTQKQVMSRINKMFGSNNILVASGRASMHGMQAQMNPTTTLKLSDLEDVAGRISNFIDWDAFQISLDKTATFNSQNATVNIYGHKASAVSVWNYTITEGRFFTKAENQSLARVAVLAPNVRKELFPNSDPVGKQIEVDGIPFQVIGTIGPRGLDPHGMNQDDEIIIPLNTLLKRVANEDYVFAAKFLVAYKSQINSNAAQVVQILRERHNINANETDDFMVETPEAIAQMIKGADRMFSLYLPLISGVFLIIGAIVVVNLMLLSVSERVKEIGLRKAVGAKSNDIQSQFLIEASSITILGGILGIILGILFLIPMTKMMNVPFIISWSAIVVCCIISVLVGIAAGFFPAKRAAGLQPAQTLH